MARYIDADKLPRNKGVLDTGLTGKMPIEFVYTEDIEKLPAADVVEVVRCRDCKLRDTEGCPFMVWDCGELMGDTEDNDYCNYGKRKE